MTLSATDNAPDCFYEHVVLTEPLPREVITTHLLIDATEEFYMVAFDEVIVIPRGSDNIVVPWPARGNQWDVHGDVPPRKYSLAKHAKRQERKEIVTFMLKPPALSQHPLVKRFHGCQQFETVAWILTSSKKERLSLKLWPKGRRTSAHRKYTTQNAQRRFYVEGDPSVGIPWKLFRYVNQKPRSMRAAMRKHSTTARECLTQEEGIQKAQSIEQINHDGTCRLLVIFGAEFVCPDAYGACVMARKSCVVCAGFIPAAKHLSQTILTTRPLQMVQFDLTKMSFKDKSTGCTQILLIVDHFTKYRWAVGVLGKHAGPVAEALYNIFSVEGAPERWHTDNGREFVNKCMKRCQKRLQV